MSQTTIRLLEDRIGKVVKRLQELSTERKRLERELNDFKARLASLESAGAKRLRGSEKDSIQKRAKEMRRQLRASIDELRGA